MNYYSEYMKSQEDIILKDEFNNIYDYINKLNFTFNKKIEFLERRIEKIFQKNKLNSYFSRYKEKCSKLVNEGYLLNINKPRQEIHLNEELNNIFDFLTNNLIERKIKLLKCIIKEINQYYHGCDCVFMRYENLVYISEIKIITKFPEEIQLNDEIINHIYEKINEFDLNVNEKIKLIENDIEKSNEYENLHKFSELNLIKHFQQQFQLKDEINNIDELNLIRHFQQQFQIRDEINNIDELDLILNEKIKLLESEIKELNEKN